MDTALYLRVSTMHQKPDLQADGLRRYAARAGLEIIAEYLDVAVSGRKEGRPQLQALMRAAYNHEFDCVLVWKFDRFARSVRISSERLMNLIISAFVLSVCRIRWTREVQWAKPCLPSSARWQNHLPPAERVV